MTAAIHFILLTTFICLGIYFSITDPTGLGSNLYY